MYQTKLCKLGFGIGICCPRDWLTTKYSHMFYIISSRSEKFPPRCRQRVRKLLQFLVCFGCNCYCSRPVGGPSWAKSLQIRPAGTFDSESQRKSTFCPPPFHGEMIIFGIKISIISRRSMHDGSKTGSKVNFGKLYLHGFWS